MCSKLQKPIVDYIKVVIKSKKHTSFQKVLALRLLNKCVEARCNEFNRYVEKKILKRLLIFAEHNKDRNSPNDLLSKGETIFSHDEKDKTNACVFLIVLLDSIEKWANICPLADNNRSPSDFAKGYQKLKSYKILFPSQVNNPKIKSVLNLDNINNHSNNQSQPTTQ